MPTLPAYIKKIKIIFAAIPKDAVQDCPSMLKLSPVLVSAEVHSNSAAFEVKSGSKAHIRSAAVTIITRQAAKMASAWESSECSILLPRMFLLLFRRQSNPSCRR